MLRYKTPFMAMLMVAALALPALAHKDHVESTFETMSESYLAIQTALAGDSLEGVRDNALTIAKSAEALDKKFDGHQAGVEKKHEADCRALMPELAASSGKLAVAKDIKGSRAAFADLSEGMVAYRNMIPGDKPNVAYCPMAKHSWLQNGKKIANPYYGSSMLRCGSIVEK